MSQEVIDVLHAAANKVRARANAATNDDWGDRPWHTEECSDTDTMESCPCIVGQGEYREFDQPQIPPVQYIADAETVEHAQYIAMMDPALGRALADWLDKHADLIEAQTATQAQGDHPAVRIARRILAAPTSLCATCPECGTAGSCNGGPCPLNPESLAPAAPGDQIQAITARNEILATRIWEPVSHQHGASGCRCLSCDEEPTGWQVEHTLALNCEELVEPTPNSFGRPRTSCEAGPLLSYEEADALAHASKDIAFLLGALKQARKEAQQITADRNRLAAAVLFARGWKPDLPMSLREGIDQILATKEANR